MRFLSSLPGLAVFVLTTKAFAAIPSVLCDGLVGCPGPGPAPVAASDVLFNSTLPTVLRLLGTFAGGIAVVMIAVAGIQMVLSAGDESKIASARWSILYALVGLSVAIMSQTIVAAVSTEVYASGASGDFLVNLMKDVIRFILIAFNVCFAIAVMIAGIRMTVGAGKTDEFQKAMTTIKWAIAGAIITNLSSALVNALLNFNF